MRGLERAVLFFLVGVIGLCLGISLFLGPVLMFPVMVLALLAIAIAQLLRRGEAREAAEVAAAAGAHAPVTVWGKVVNVTGRCPTGETPQPGQRFAVADGGLWPALCEHAQGVVLQEVARMERGETPDEVPARYHDADHTMEMALYKAPRSLRAAA
jgi:hypothetical protein